jgi:quercetin dioxygenase-like cupin family protein
MARSTRGISDAEVHIDTNEEVNMSVRVVASSLPLVLLLAAGTAQAQDPVKVAPDHFTVLLENERVRVLDFHSNPGVKVPLHSHPAYVSYSITGKGKTKFTSADGKVTEPTAKTGQATWHEPETHASEYQGAGSTHVLLVELKGQ